MSYGVFNFNFLALSLFEILGAGLKVGPGLPGRRPGTDLVAIYLPGLYRVACFYSFSAHNYSNFTD